MRLQFLLAFISVISTGNSNFELGKQPSNLYFLARPEKMAGNDSWVIAIHQS